MPFITANDPLWKNILKHSAYDIYHLPGYTEIEAKLLKGTALGWYYHFDETDILIPLVSRPINAIENYHDLISPYGYPGILTSVPLSGDDISSILLQFSQEALQAGFVSSFIRLNPLYNTWKLGAIPQCRQWFHGLTVAINLQLTIHDLREDYSENHQRNLKKLERLGYYYKINYWQDIDYFLQAYRQTMVRKQAHPYYFFPDDYFEALKNLAGKHLIFISVYEPMGKFTSGGLFTLYGSIMQYHLGGTDNEFLKFSPSKMMIHAAILKGMELGAKLLHLGGGVGANAHDGLFRFKKGFGQLLFPYSTLRMVHLPEVYAFLKKKFPITKPYEDYFPEYRIHKGSS